METEYSKLALKYQDQALEALKEDIRINSVYDEKTRTEENPFGLGVRKALDFIAEKGEELGFKADLCDHYASELSYGEGKIIDIYAHQDVVPVSSHWESDPFYPTIKDGVMYARGSADDKGPGIAALYGAKIALDQGWLEGCRLRIIFGGNEERGSLCLEHYFHEMKKEYPFLGFSPDADYPLIFAEKGIFTYKATYKLADKRIPSFYFGTATNIVLDEAGLKIADPAINEESLKAYLSKHPEVKGTFKDGFVSFKGQASHGSVPWNGVNAGLHLFNYLGSNLNIKPFTDLFLDYEKGDGKPFKGDFTSDYFDSSSYCAGIFDYDGEKLTVLINMRLPENVSGEKGAFNARKMTSADEIELLGGSPALIVDPDSALVKSLMKAYQEETGDYKSKPLAIGGGTYARDSKNSVAFGMEFPGVDSKMHQDGEFMRIEDFNKSIAIYAHAIRLLADIATGRNKD